MTIGTEAVLECCRRIMRAQGNKPWTYSEQAVVYASHCLTMIKRAEPVKDIKVQVLYILSNLANWRGDEARMVKQTLREFGK